MTALTVILPAFNSARTLGAALTSIIGQTFADWELLVMDDGSKDATVEIARGFGDGRIQVIADGTHRGLPAQLNRAVQMARGRYLARMDADDLAYPTRFQKQVDFLEGNSEIDLVSGWMTVFRSDGALLGARRGPVRHQEICAHAWRGIPMAHPTWMGRVEWFRANPYKEDQMRMEDRELLLRTYQRSRFAAVPEIVLAYREDSLSLRKILQARRNTCRMALRLAREERKFALAAKVIGGQCGRSLIEIVAVPTGLNYKVLRSRAQTPTTEECAAWEKMWAAITEPEARARFCSRGTA